MRFSFLCLTIPLLLLHTAKPQQAETKGPLVHLAGGTLQGQMSGKIAVFHGIPFAAPPVGPLRWKEPQPVASWSGVRRASEYGARCMQGRIYGDMIFHDDGPSEDCLYLNLWMPAHPVSSRL